MASMRAVAKGFDKSRIKETHRLGHQEAQGQANTWRTIATAHVRADGSGYVEVARDGVTIHYLGFGKEEG